MRYNKRCRKCGKFTRNENNGIFAPLHPFCRNCIDKMWDGIDKAMNGKIKISAKIEPNDPHIFHSYLD